MVAGIGLASLASDVPPAAGQIGIPVTLRYAVKFVCGVSGNGEQPDKDLPLTIGRYHTVINVHNPSLKSKLTFFKKVAVASASPYKEAQLPGKITEFCPADLEPNQAFEIDCPEIQKLTGLPIGGGRYIDGFVVIMSPSELDVVAVYTARPTGQGGGEISTLHVLPITGRDQREVIRVTPEVPCPLPDGGVILLPD